MMRQISYIGGLFALLLASCSLNDNNDYKEQINILPAFNMQTKLKVSQLGKSIRYVPLETTDSSLIDDIHEIRLLEKCIMITSHGNCFLYDRQTGKYLGKIGNRGQGPREYSDAMNFVHYETGDVYFNRTPNKMIAFKQNGDFLKELKLPFKWSSSCFLIFDKSNVIAHEAMALNRIYRFKYSGEIVDSIQLLHSRPIDTPNMKMPTILKGPIASEVIGLGMFAYNGALIIPYKNGERKDIIPLYYPSLYNFDGEIRFHEAYSDTVFNIKGSKLVPQWIFNTGNLHFPREKYGNIEESKERIVITYVAENKNLIFFQCAKSWFADKGVEICNAIYRKSDGHIIMNKRDKGFEDDLSHFIPFQPIAFDGKDGIAGILSVEKIQEWLETHPNIQLDGPLASIKDLPYDANPVIVIVED